MSELRSRLLRPTSPRRTAWQSNPPRRRSPGNEASSRLVQSPAAATWSLAGPTVCHALPAAFLPGCFCLATTTTGCRSSPATWPWPCSR